MPPPLPPAIKGIGVDLLHLPRLNFLLFQRPHTKPKNENSPESMKSLDAHVHRFARRILSVEELSVFKEKFLKQLQVHKEKAETRSNMVKWLGVRWAAKEAIYKAYPHPHPLAHDTSQRLLWKEVSVRYHPNRKPYLYISRIIRTVTQQEQELREECLLSVSHDDDYVIAIAEYISPNTFAESDDNY